MVTPEFKKVIGQRQSNSDGFALSYGRFKFNKSRCRQKNQIKREKRALKKAIKNAENKRFFDCL
jgi:hypothetical protein